MVLLRYIADVLLQASTGSSYAPAENAAPWPILLPQPTVPASGEGKYQLPDSNCGLAAAAHERRRPVSGPLEQRTSRGAVVSLITVFEAQKRTLVAAENNSLGIAELVSPSARPTLRPLF
jgi:hypothetical protein